MPLKTIQKLILSHMNEIAEAANQRTFQLLASYKNNRVTPSESLEATKQLLNIIVRGLENKETNPNEHDDFLKEIVTFKDGIATKRVDYKVDIVDLLISINIVKEEIWNKIRTSEFFSSDINMFFDLERNLNSIFDRFTVETTGKFIAIRDELINCQNDSLKMWEEVVKSTSHLTLKIPCRGEFVVIARTQAEAIARRLNFDNEAVDDLVLTIGEICDNAIEHGYSEKGVDIRYSITPQELIVEVVDYGKGFNPEGKGEEVPDLMTERGRGIYIMKQLADSVSIQSKEKEGTKVTVRKKRVFI